ALFLSRSWRAWGAARRSKTSAWGGWLLSDIVIGVAYRTPDRGYFAHRDLFGWCRFQLRQSPHQKLMPPHAQARIPDFLDFHLSVLFDDVAMIHDSQLYRRRAAQPYELQELAFCPGTIPGCRIDVVQLILVIVFPWTLFWRLV